MRIVCFIPNLGSGGAQRQLVELAKGFKEKGHEVSFLVLYEGGDHDFFEAELEASGIAVAHVEAWQPSIKKILHVRKHLRALQPDIILSFLEFVNVLTLFAGIPHKKWKTIVGERSADPGIKSSAKRRFYRKCYRFADFVVANSHSNIALLKEVAPGLSDERLKVVYNTVDPDIWKPDPSYQPLEGGRLRLVVAASHYPYKNALGLIKAMGKLPPGSLKKLRVDWYGKVSDKAVYEQCLAAIEDLGISDNIRFLPPTNNLPQIFREADAVGLFSFIEGLPNTVCEGLATGKPVIASDVSDVSHLVLHSPELLFDPNDVAQITASLESLLKKTEEELLELGKLNRQVALEKLNRNKIVDSYLALFK